MASYGTWFFIIALIGITLFAKRKEWFASQISTQEKKRKEKTSGQGAGERVSQAVTFVDKHRKTFFTWFGKKWRETRWLSPTLLGAYDYFVIAWLLDRHLWPGYFWAHTISWYTPVVILGFILAGNSLNSEGTPFKYSYGQWNIAFTIVVMVASFLLGDMGVKWPKAAQVSLAEHVPWQQTTVQAATSASQAPTSVATTRTPTSFSVGPEYGEEIKTPGKFDIEEDGPVTIMTDHGEVEDGPGMSVTRVTTKWIKVKSRKEYGGTVNVTVTQ